MNDGGEPSEDRATGDGGPPSDSHRSEDRVPRVLGPLWLVIVGCLVLTIVLIVGYFRRGELLFALGDIFIGVVLLLATYVYRPRQLRWE